MLIIEVVVYSGVEPLHIILRGVSIVLSNPMIIKNE